VIVKASNRNGNRAARYGLLLFWPADCIYISMESKRKIKRLEDLLVWCKAKDLGIEVYLLTNTGKFSKDYPLRDQIRRAVISISSNIAEGFGRYNPGEFRNYLSIASGSTSEVKSQLHLAADLGYLGGLEAKLLIERCDEITRMIAGLRSKTK
jgi:four helix bundle protein